MSERNSEVRLSGKYGVRETENGAGVKTAWCNSPEGMNKGKKGGVVTGKSFHSERQKHQEQVRFERVSAKGERGRDNSGGMARRAHLTSRNCAGEEKFSLSPL